MSTTPKDLIRDCILQSIDVEGMTEEIGILMAVKDARILRLEDELKTTKSILDATQAALRRASEGLPV